MARCTWLKTYATQTRWSLGIRLKYSELLQGLPFTKSCWGTGSAPLNPCIQFLEFLGSQPGLHSQWNMCMFWAGAFSKEDAAPESWCHNINRPVYHRSAGSWFNTFCLFFKTMLDNSWLNLKSTKLFESVIWICRWFQNRICDIISIRGVGNDPNFQVNIWHIWHLWTTRWFKLQHHLVNCSDHVCSNFTASQVIGQWMPIPIFRQSQWVDTAWSPVEVYYGWGRFQFT